MRILVFGAGAIGTYIGGSLELVGQEVIFIERPQVAQDLRARGLSLQIQAESQHIPSPQVYGSLQEALETGRFDIGIFALKSFDTRPALEQLRPHWESLPPILCLQNGVENESVLAEALGQERVIPGTVTSAIGRNSAGDIVLERSRGVGIAGDHPLIPRLKSVMSQAELNVQYYPNASDMKWSKMLTNLVANATSAILDMSPAEIFSDRRLFRFEIAQLRETLSVMRAQGINVVDLPGTPVRLLVFGVRYIPARISGPLMKRAIGAGRGAKMPSLHIDLHSKRAMSEVNYLNGAVVRFGGEFGIPTPVNRYLNETLLALTRGDLPTDKFARQPGKLLANFNMYP